MKTVKKALITALSFFLLISALGACSSDGSSSGTTKPGSENVSKPDDGGSKGQESAKAGETGTHPPRPAKPEKPKDVIVPLYDTAYESEIRSLYPWDLNSYQWFSKYFSLTDSGRENEKGIKYEQFKGGASFAIKPFPGIKSQVAAEELKDLKESYEVVLYFYEQFGGVSKYAEIDGAATASGGFLFIPLFYNETQGCFAGYSMTNAICRFSEYYYDPVQKGFCSQLAYPADYGYTDEILELQKKTKSLDEIIPMFDTKYEKEILESSPKDLFETENFKTYLALEAGEGSDPEMGPFYLGSGKNFSIKTMPMTLEDEYRSYDVEISYKKYDALRMYYRIKETSSEAVFGTSGNFFPLYYNKTQGYILGYYDSQYSAEPELDQLNVVFGSSLTAQYASSVLWENDYVFEAATEPRKDENPEILSVFYWDMEEEIRKEDPVDLFKEENFRKYYQLSETDKTSDMASGKLYKIETDVPLEIRTTSGNPEKSSAVIELYVSFQKNEPQVSLFYEMNGEIKWSGFSVPLYYNSTEGSLVEYDSGYDGTDYDVRMLDSFYSNGSLFGIVIDKAKYGF